MYEGNNSIQDLGMPYGNSKEFSFSKHESPPDYSARKSGEVNTDENETSLKTLKNKLRLLETSLEEQRAAAKHLREERDEGLTMNGLLKREVEELRRGVYEGKNRSSAHLKSRKYTRGIDEDNSLVAYVLALPSQLIRGLFNRVALFVWWTGSWANEGLGILRIENKWVSLQQVKNELEEDNSRLEQQVHELQHRLTDKEVQIIRQIERNKELVCKLNGRCSFHSGDETKLDKLAKNVQAIKAVTEGLGEEIDRMRDAMDRWLTRFDRVHYEIGRLSEKQQRIQENWEQSMVRNVHNAPDATPPGCLCSRVAQENVTSKPIVEEVIAESSNKENSEDKSPDEGQKNEILRAVVDNKSRSFRVCRCSVSRILIIFSTFLMTGIIFHFILVAASLRFPPNMGKEFYGVDLYALWACFINWIFCLLVTE